MNQESLYALADLLGVTRSYTGLDGSEHQTSPEVAEAFIAGMGLDVSEHTLDRLRRERWTAGVRGVHVARPEQHARVPVVHPKSADAGAIEWVLTQEDGETTRGRTPVSECAVLEEGDYDLERALVLPVLPLGYHRLAVGDSQCRIVCAPEPAFRPPVLDERRVWGPALQLYALRTENNWGVGDFADLLPAIDWFASLGADFIGLNPLHALFVDKPAH
ncbi:MAG: 4-alpha-glucanotransferase, partial [Myxococcota bacterium]